MNQGFFQSGERDTFFHCEQEKGFPRDEDKGFDQALKDARAQGRGGGGEDLVEILIRLLLFLWGLLEV